MRSTSAAPLRVRAAVRCLDSRVGDRADLPREPGCHDLLRCEARVAAHDQHSSTTLPTRAQGMKSGPCSKLAVDVKSVFRSKLRSWQGWCGPAIPVVPQVTSRRQCACRSDRSIAFYRVTVWLVMTDKVAQCCVLPRAKYALWLSSSHHLRLWVWWIGRCATSSTPLV